jgi:hypothetical protein
LASIAKLLQDRDSTIRCAALAALPGTLPASLGSVLVMELPFLTADLAGETMGALARCPSRPEFEEPLNAQLEQRTSHCATILEGWASRGAPVTCVEAVLGLAGDSTVPMSVRVRALRCLEQTPSTAVVDGVDQLWLDHPVLDYLTGRILLRDQRISGVHRLHRVLRATPDAPPAEDLKLLQEARLGARQILAMLADTGIYTDVSVWTHWANDVRELPRVRLPQSTLRPES